MAKSNFQYLKVWDEETKSRFIADAQIYSTRELAEMYSIKSKSTVLTLMERLQVPPMSKEARQKIQQRVVAKLQEGRQRMTQEQIRLMFEHTREAEVKVIKSERRRLLFGLEQKTKLRLNINKKAARKRTAAKSRLIRRNKYIADNDSSELYYDAETIRSKYLESKYSRLFTFMPAEGFIEADSRWVKQINTWKITDSKNQAS